VSRLLVLTRALVAAVIVMVSLANAGRPIRRLYHLYMTNTTDALPVREREMAHAKTVVRALAAGRLAYFDEEPGWKTIEAVGEYYVVQYALAPAVLRRDSTEDQFALVNFRLSKTPKPMPGYTFMEDLGGGLAMYRRR